MVFPTFVNCSARDSRIVFHVGYMWWAGVLLHAAEGAG